MSKRIVLEGIDCSGKTTSAIWISKEENLTLLSPKKEHKNDFDYYDKLFSENENCILDRGFLSEIVYAKQYKRRERITISQVAKLIEKYKLNVKVFLTTNYLGNFEYQNIRHLKTGEKVDQIKQLKEDTIAFITIIKMINNKIEGLKNRIEIYNTIYDKFSHAITHNGNSSVVVNKAVTKRVSVPLDIKRKIIAYDLTGKKYISGNIKKMESAGLFRSNVIKALNGNISTYCSLIFRYENDKLEKHKLPFSFGRTSDNEFYITCSECGHKMSLRMFISKKSKICNVCKDINAAANTKFKSKSYDEKVYKRKKTECNVCHKKFDTEVDKRGVPYNKTCPVCKENIKRNPTEKGIKKNGKVFMNQTNGFQ